MVASQMTFCKRRHSFNPGGLQDVPERAQKAADHVGQRGALRERAQLTDQIEALKKQAERQSADHRQTLAALTDQRGQISKPVKRGLWARLVGV